MTTLPTIMGKTQFQVQRETLEFAAALCESMYQSHYPHSKSRQTATECADSIRAHIPSVVETNHG